MSFVPMWLLLSGLILLVCALLFSTTEQKRFIGYMVFYALMVGFILSHESLALGLIGVILSSICMRLALDDARLQSVEIWHLALFIIASLGVLYVEKSYFHLVVGCIWGLLFFCVHRFFPTGLGQGDIYFALGAGFLLGAGAVTLSFLLATAVGLLFWYKAGAKRHIPIPLLAYWAPSTIALWLLNLII